MEQVSFSTVTNYIYVTNWSDTWGLLLVDPILGSYNQTAYST